MSRPKITDQSPKGKSTGSTKSKRRTNVRKSKGSIPDELTPPGPQEIASAEDDDGYEPINYRDEITYLFFTSAVQHIIESREKIIEAVPEIETPLKAQPSVKKIELEPATPKGSRQKSRQKKNYKLTESLTKKSASNPSMLSLGSKVSSRRMSQRNFMSEHSFPILPVGITAPPPKRQKKYLGWMVKSENKTEKIVFKNGNVYEGNTSRWLMHGKGTYTWADGTTYTGDFNNGHPHGIGTMVLCDLSTYEGDFRRGYFHGNGVFCIASTPSIYKGNWRNGKKHGYGWYLYEQNNWYEGDYVEDRKHGIGYRRYNKGTRYKGMWSNDMKNGQGSMVWENNDYYAGEWKDGKPDGYGEYTWNIISPKYFVFPYYNWYKGSWENGVRSGVGIMNFGTESGAKLLGIWENNLKHGPGIMVCGNGLTLQCNPLFSHDKPVHYNDVKRELENGDDLELKHKISQDLIEERMQSKTMQQTIVDDKDIYRKIAKQINEKVALKTFQPNILKTITQNGANINQNQYSKYKSELKESEKFCPLELSIHTIAEEFDLSYYMEVICDHYYTSMGDLVSYKSTKSLHSESTQYNKSRRSSKDIKYNRINEEKLVRNVITMYLSKLTVIYDQYAAMMTEETHLKQKVVLTRLFLWQIFRDIEVPQKGVSLVELDLFIAKNPKCCLETDHYPFEPIYFWQFIQALLACAWLLHTTSNRNSTTEEFTCGGNICQIFRIFMEDHFCPNVGRFVGTALTRDKDLIPIKSVHALYLKIGEPHSVFDFLYFTCTKDDKEPPCYASIDDGEDTYKNLREGINVTIGDKLMYIEAKDDITSRISRQTKQRKEQVDIFYKTLFTFRSLSRQKILIFLRTVCPLAVVRGKPQLDYKLTFLEFYETLLLCAYEKAQIKRKSEEIYKQEDQLTIKSSRGSSAFYKIGPTKQKKKQYKSHSNHT